MIRLGWSKHPIPDIHILLLKISEKGCTEPDSCNRSDKSHPFFSIRLITAEVLWLKTVD